MSIVDIIRGDGALILAQPHGGTSVPDPLLQRFNSFGRALADTDWHIPRLYRDLVNDATVISATTHRYVIDANRDPGGSTLYADQTTTALCPLTDFEGREIYKPGQEPDRDEIAARCEEYHRPYHTALKTEIERLQQKHDAVVLYDCHSIRSALPYLFNGQLPVFNIGTNDGASCAAVYADAVVEHCERAPDYDTVRDGRFKGGWTTRHYGDPTEGVHAIQMEIAQRAYMHETPPWTYDEQRAGKLRAHLTEVLTTLQRLTQAAAVS